MCYSVIVQYRHIRIWETIIFWFVILLPHTKPISVESYIFCNSALKYNIPIRSYIFIYFEIQRYMKLILLQKMRNKNEQSFIFLLIFISVTYKARTMILKEDDNLKGNIFIVTLLICCFIIISRENNVWIEILYVVLVLSLRKYIWNQ